MSARGVLLFEGQRIGLRSIHTFGAGKLPTAAPLGYGFDAEGEAIGAVDLNGLHKTIHAPARGRDRRQPRPVDILGPGRFRLGCRPGTSALPARDEAPLL
jgi:hypothetical protein